MQTLHLAKALLPDGWATDVRLDIGPDGTIGDVVAGVPADGAERVPGAVLPGMIDLHCHSFQRAMAGLAERREAGPSSFWGWRELMYRFLQRIGPDELWAITAQLHVELLKGGYTAVCEFHYLHNQPDGEPYDDPALLALVIHEAAATAGIGLTLLPSLYMAGGFGGRPVEPAQRRFALTPERYFALLDRVDTRLRDDRDRRLGMAPHSLRAVPARQLREVVDERRRSDPYAPIHLHLAEQPGEVAACRAAHGLGPGELLLREVEVDHHWCLVHGTHLTPGELAELAACKAVIGLCPTTEANLGDGCFALPAWQQLQGRFGVGSDSNLCRSWAEELRMLEYGQRLAHGQRLVAATPDQPAVGAGLFRRALQGGTQAAGRLVGRLAPGARADLVVLDTSDPVLAGRTDDRLLDTLVFASDRPLARHVMVGGAWRIRDYAHAAERSIADAFRMAVRRLDG